MVTDRPLTKSDDNDKDKETCNPKCCNVDLPLKSETSTEEETQATVKEVQKNDTNSPWAVISNYLEKRGRRIVEVRGDGHFLLFAISVSLKEESFANVSSDELCLKLRNEINDNKQYYQTFLSGDIELLDDVDKYIAENNIIQIALTSFCRHCAMPLA